MKIGSFNLSFWQCGVLGEFFCWIQWQKPVKFIAYAEAMNYIICTIQIKDDASIFRRLCWQWWAFAISHPVGGVWNWTLGKTWTFRRILSRKQLWFNFNHSKFEENAFHSLFVFFSLSLAILPSLLLPLCLSSSTFFRDENFHCCFASELFFQLSQMS